MRRAKTDMIVLQVGIGGTRGATKMRGLLTRLAGLSSLFEPAN